MEEVKVEFGDLGLVVNDNFLIIKKDKIEEKKSGLIHVVDLNERPSTTGVVVGFGKGSWQNGLFITNEISLGDKVWFGPGGMNFNIEGNEYLVIKPHDIICLKKAQ